MENKQEIIFKIDKILDQRIKNEIEAISNEFNSNLITEDEVQDVLMGLELSYKLDYELLYEFFRNNIKKQRRVYKHSSLF